MGDGDEFFVVKWQFGERGRLGGESEDGEVDAAVAKLLEQTLGLFLHDARLQVLVLGPQARQEIRQKVRGDRGDHPDGQRAVEHAVGALCAGDESVGCFERGFCEGEQLLAGGGDDDLARRALDELDAQPALERDEGLRQRRLRDTELGRGGAEVLVLRDRDEGAQLRERRFIFLIAHAYHHTAPL